jgi:DNA topoisomerase VI subunit A
MEISRIQQQQIKEYNLEQVRLQEKRDKDYQKVIEKRTFDQIVAERVSRNIRLDLDKGQNVDLEC